MGEDDKNPNILRNFTSSEIGFKNKFLKGFQQYSGGGVKAIWTFSKQKEIFSDDGFPKSCVLLLFSMNGSNNIWIEPFIWGMYGRYLNSAPSLEKLSM